MPDPSTTRLALYKSKSDGSETVNYTQDIGQNLDTIDLAVGFQAVTSSTRPSSPYSGKPIMQTNTSYSTYFHNGTSPASAGWVEIPNSSAAYQGRLVTLYPGSTSATSLVRLAQTGAAAGNRALATRGSGDTVDHWQMDFDGTIQWGPGGSTAVDTNLYRSAADTLKTDDSLIVTGDLTVQGKDKGRGLMSKIVRTTATSGFTTTEVTIMTAPSFTWVNGRAYRMTVFGSFQSSITTGYMLLRIRKGTGTAGTVYIDGIRVRVLDTFANTDLPVNFVFNLVNTSGADITTAVTLTANAQSGTIIWNNAAATTYVTIEDVGLAADWAGTPIS